MNTLRQRLPRMAALVLLLWLFVTGVAFAHTCQSKIDIDCDGCCVEMSAPQAFSNARTDTALAAAAAPVTLPAPEVVQVAWQPAAEFVPPATDPPDRGSPTDIPVVFLRLAL